jgi:hypothetical protein
MKTFTSWCKSKNYNEGSSPVAESDPKATLHQTMDELDAAKEALEKIYQNDTMSSLVPSLVPLRTELRKVINAAYQHGSSQIDSGSGYRGWDRGRQY